MLALSCSFAVGLASQPHLAAVQQPHLAVVQQPHYATMPRSAALRRVMMQTTETTEAAASTRTELAAKAREWVLNDGFHKPAKTELIADDFVWFGPIVGPLNKEDFLGTVSSFEVYNGFPDMEMALSE